VLVSRGELVEIGGDSASRGGRLLGSAPSSRSGRPTARAPLTMRTRMAGRRCEVRDPCAFIPNSARRVRGRPLCPRSLRWRASTSRDDRTSAAERSSTDHARSLGDPLVARASPRRHVVTFSSERSSPVPAGGVPGSRGPLIDRARRAPLGSCPPHGPPSLVALEARSTTTSQAPITSSVPRDGGDVACRAAGARGGLGGERPAGEHRTLRATPIDVIDVSSLAGGARTRR